MIICVALNAALVVVVVVVVVEGNLLRTYDVDILTITPF